MKLTIVQHCRTYQENVILETFFVTLFDIYKLIFPINENVNIIKHNIFKKNVVKIQPLKLD